MADGTEARVQQNIEAGESSEQAEAQKLDDATFEPQAYVEQTGDYRQAEAIQENFTTLMDNTVSATADTSDPAPASEAQPAAAMVEREATVAGHEPTIVEGVLTEAPGKKEDGASITPINLPDVGRAAEAQPAAAMVEREETVAGNEPSIVEGVLEKVSGGGNESEDDWEAPGASSETGAATEETGIDPIPDLTAAFEGERESSAESAGQIIAEAENIRIEGTKGLAGTIPAALQQVAGENISIDATKGLSGTTTAYPATLPESAVDAGLEGDEEQRSAEDSGLGLWTSKSTTGIGDTAAAAAPLINSRPAPILGEKEGSLPQVASSDQSGGIGKAAEEVLPFKKKKTKTEPVYASVLGVKFQIGSKEVEITEETAAPKEMKTASDTGKVVEGEEIAKKKHKEKKTKAIMAGFGGVEWPIWYEEYFEEGAKPKEPAHAGDAGKVNDGVEISKTEIGKAAEEVLPFKKKKTKTEPVYASVLGVKFQIGSKEVEITEETAAPKEMKTTGDTGKVVEGEEIAKKKHKEKKTKAIMAGFGGVEWPIWYEEYFEEEAQPKKSAHAGDAGKLNDGVQPSPMEKESKEGRRDALPDDEKKEDDFKIGKKRE